MADFGKVQAPGLTSQQYQKLQDMMGPAGKNYDDWRTRSKEMNDAIKQGFARSSSDTTTTDTNAAVVSGTILAALGALYDRYEGEAFRIGKDKIPALVKGIMDAAGKFSITALAGNIGALMKQTLSQAMVDMQKIDDKIRQVINKNAMFAGDLGGFMREELRSTLPLAQEMGVSVEDFLDGAERLFSAQGRMVTYSQETLRYAVTVGKAYTDSATDIMTNVDNFRNVGIGLSDAASDIEKIGKRSISLGLNAKQVTKTVMDNLDKMNQYGFKNGIEGLSKMVQKSQSLKISMDAVFKIADKAFDPEGAIELTANLQAIGLAFGDLKDPMRAMYDTTNNMEGIQDAFMQAAASIAVYNGEQKRFEITGANIRKAKALADAYGVSLKEVTDAATKGAAKIQAMSELSMFGGLSPEEQEFASNMAQIGKGGKLGIEVPKGLMDELQLKESFIELGNLTGDQIKKIQDFQTQISGMSTEEIALDQMNTTTKILNTLTAISLGLQDSVFKSDMSKTTRDFYEDVIYKNLREYGPGRSQDVIKKGEGLKDDFFKEVEKGMNTEEIKGMKEELKKLKGKINGPNGLLNNLPDMIPKGLLGNEGAMNTNKKVDVYFHASENYVAPFMRALEADGQFRRDLASALEAPSYLAGPQQVTT